MPLLGVNIDHVATVRQQRKGTFPDPVEAALAAERAGADSITAHLREDRRHIQDADILRLRREIRTKLNLEMSIAEEIVKFAVRVRPQDACLVPERRQELTTEGGLDVAGQKAKVSRAVARLKRARVRVSLFIDPDVRQIRAAREAGADCVELHTGTYADARGSARIRAEFRKLAEAGEEAHRLGLTLNAGHGLDYGNVVPVASLAHMHELNIGFSIIGRSLFVGIGEAVREMKRLIDRSRWKPS
jgi:pyridoxine 5-phosphate synthase